MLWFALLVAVKVTGYHYGVYTMSEATMQLFWADILWATALLLTTWLVAGLVIIASRWAGSSASAPTQRVIYVTKEQAQQMGLPHVDVYSNVQT